MAVQSFTIGAFMFGRNRSESEYESIELVFMPVLRLDGMHFFRVQWRWRGAGEVGGVGIEYGGSAGF